MAIDTKYGTVTVEKEPGLPLNGTNEPVFLLRARDKAAIQTLYQYQRYCMEIGAEDEHINAIDGVISVFEYFREVNPKLMKVPD